MTLIDDKSCQVERVAKNRNFAIRVPNTCGALCTANPAVLEFEFGLPLLCLLPSHPNFCELQSNSCRHFARFLREIPSLVSTRRYPVYLLVYFFLRRKPPGNSPYKLRITQSKVAVSLRCLGLVAGCTDSRSKPGGNSSETNGFVQISQGRGLDRVRT